MKIPGNPFDFGPGFLRQPQPGTRQQPDAELQVKANAPGGAKVSGDHSPGIQAVKTAASAGPRVIDEMVSDLAAEGRLPRRGSLLDILA